MVQAFPNFSTIKIIQTINISENLRKYQDFKIQKLSLNILFNPPSSATINGTSRILVKYNIFSCQECVYSSVWALP